MLVEKPLHIFAADIMKISYQYMFTLKTYDYVDLTNNNRLTIYKYLERLSSFHYFLKLQVDILFEKINDNINNVYLKQRQKCMIYRFIYMGGGGGGGQNVRSLLLQTCFMISDMWCISSSGRMFWHVALMYYTFTYFSTRLPWVPRSAPENVRFEWYTLFLWIVFSWFWVRQNPPKDVRF